MQIENDLLEPTTENPIPKVAWKIKDWAESASLSIAYTYELINAGKIKSVKVGGTRRIIISPQEFYRILSEEQHQVLNLDLGE